ncbi:PEP-CTERM sorting domain-containing protein [Thalassoroseus pseudoceratinae]|uniref:PEP-CTERM sorting domain-containing protein n=1 Tax=Thalassoroseus pseudoceratinae TaxID=2713176 RepID=UPI00141E736F|nr:PEP-CTERM sorting domain-containing protein [Thalassoroseus pseudoceratinae]
MSRLFSYTLLTFVVAASIGMNAQASPIVNGEFDSVHIDVTPPDLGWQSIGNPVVISAQAELSTDTSILAGAIANFVDLSVSRLEEFGDSPANGSAIKQTFEVLTGGKLSFDWSFITSENNTGENNDFAFWSLSGANNGERLANAESGATAFQTKTYDVDSAGIYTLAFGVMNENNDFGPSQLLIDNVSFEATATSGSPTPEPGTWAMMALGMIGFAGVWYRQKVAVVG